MRIVPWLPPLFVDRAAAGRALAGTLAGMPLDDPVVVGVAHGGVAVAAEVARELGAPLTAVDVERVEVGGRRLGAATVDGEVYLAAGVPAREGEVEAAVSRARRVAAALEKTLEVGARPLAGRTALVVDDGVITGLTLAAACRWARARHVRRLVAATPVGRRSGLARIAAEADLVVCSHELDEMVVVGQAYDAFDRLDDWYVGTLLGNPAGECGA